MRTRQPAVAGRFYPDSAEEIDKQLARIRNTELDKIDLGLARHTILGAIVPHAGYMYSAYQAMHFFEILRNCGQRFETFFIINPNHTGFGPEIALDENDWWETPYGPVEVDKIFHGFLHFPESSEAHKFEHSGEVMVPMLQNALDYDFRIVPVTMLRQTPQNAAAIAKAIVEANRHLHKRICIIASSDFSHFVSPEVGRQMDRYVIRNILEFDSEGIFREVREKHISVCGYGPIMVLIEYVKMISSNPFINILRTGHSGEVSHSDEVVDYVSALFYEKAGG